MPIAIVDIVRMTTVAQAPIIQASLADNFTTARAFTKSITSASVVFLAVGRTIVVQAIVRTCLLDKSLLGVDMQTPAWTLTLHQNFVLVLIPIGIVPFGMFTTETSARVEVHFQIPLLAFRFRNAAVFTNHFVAAWLLTTGQLTTLGARFALLVIWVPA